MSVFTPGSPYGSLKLPADLGRSVLRGECLIRDPVNWWEGNLPSSNQDTVFGFVEDEAGGDAGQSEPVRLLRRGAMSVRIQDNAAVAVGAILEPSDSDPGAVRTYTGGTPVGVALEAITAATTNQYTWAEIFCDQVAAPFGLIGTAGTGVTAVEQAAGAHHTTTLTLATTLPPIAGGAALAVGKLIYTFPAGVIGVNISHMRVALTQTEGNINADTPDVGIGTVIASGVVAVLGGTATFENIVTGQTAANCTGTVTTVTLGPTAGTILPIERTGVHTVFLNVADTWAAGGDVGALLTGEVILDWTYVGIGA